MAQHDGGSTDFPHLHPDHGLHLALERIGASGYSGIPVVSRADVHRLLGVVVLDDLLGAYGLSDTVVPVRHGTAESAKEV
jgi:hypothetical protein